MRDYDKRDKILSTLKDLKDELAAAESTKNEIIRGAHKRAGMMLGLGLAGCTAQLFGFTIGIYHLSDWNEMEPWTWTF